MKSKYKELAVNTVIFACASLGAKVIMFLLLPVYTHVLTTGEYGTVELILTGINLLTPILTLSITDAILRFGLDESIPHEKVLKCSVVFLTASSVVMAACIPVIRLYEPLKQYAWLFAVTMIVFMFRSAFTFYLKAVGKNLSFAADTILYTLLLALLNILLLVVFQMKVVGYMLSLDIAGILSVFFCIAVSGAWKDMRRCRFDRKLLGEMLVYSVPLILNAISWWITNSSDKYMLEYFASSSEVGIYAAAAKIPALLSTVNALFSQAWTLSAVKEYDASRERGFYSNIFGMFAACMMIAAGAVLIIVKPFMKLYVGEAFSDAWMYVPVLLFGALMGSCSSFFGSLYVATRKNISCTISTLLCGGINLILNGLLIPKMGIMGAAVATAAAYLFVGIYRMLDCQRQLQFAINYKKHCLALLLVAGDVAFVTVSSFRYIGAAGIFIIICIIYRQEISAMLRHGRGFLARGR